MTEFFAQGQEPLAVRGIDDHPVAGQFLFEDFDLQLQESDLRVAPGG